MCVCERLPRVGLKDDPIAVLLSGLGSPAMAGAQSASWMDICLWVTGECRHSHLSPMWALFAATSKELKLRRTSVPNAFRAWSADRRSAAQLGAAFP